MRKLDAAHPGYGFAKHKGSSVPEHLAAALRSLGACPLHRTSFGPVRDTGSSAAAAVARK